MKTLILNTVSDLVSDFVYYDRKKDQELTYHKLHQAIADGTITTDEISYWFKKELEASTPIIK
jgi:hypothetical protein